MHHCSHPFNEVVGLYAHNQQESTLVANNEFMHIFALECSSHALMLQFRATINEGCFVGYAVSDDKWWLCDRTTVKGLGPPRTLQKEIFLLYKRKRTNLLVPCMSQSASRRKRPSALRNKEDAQRMPTDTRVPTVA